LGGRLNNITKRDTPPARTASKRTFYESAIEHKKAQVRAARRIGNKSGSKDNKGNKVSKGN
jgi:hypothetical protein